MFIIEIPYLSLERIANTKQGLRWKKISDPAVIRTRVDSQSKYIIPSGNKVIKVEQKKDRFAFSCNDEEFFETWYNFFDLPFDYEKAVRTIYHSVPSGSELRRLLWKGKSLRILNQDLVETIITQVMVEGKPVWEARYLIESFCEVFGEKHKQSMLESGKVTWYGLPDIERLSKIEYEDLNFLLLGEKQRFLFQIIQDIVNGELDVESMPYMSSIEALDYLMGYGIKKLTAKYICLYALGHKDIFPIPRDVKDKIEELGHEPYEQFLSSCQ